MKLKLTLLVFLTGVSPLLSKDADALLKTVQNRQAVQDVYRLGVPHTDKNGNLLQQYDPLRSFFQIAIWGNPFGKAYGVDYDLTTLTEAGFNSMWPWHRPLQQELEAGQAAGLQVIHMGALDTGEAAKFRDHPAWIGNVWMDEPTGHFWGKDMEGKFKEFLLYTQQINQAAPGRPVFINDVPWVTAPATSWWEKWNNAGDVSCHDNYPILARKRRSRTIGDEGPRSGIPLTVGFATAVNEERKPVWLIVGAFSQRTHGAFPFRFASPPELRAQVYSGIVNGATGIVYFAWDTFVCRDGGVMGMAPVPRTQYLPAVAGQPRPTPVKPMEIAQSGALWQAAGFINRELRELTPALLSPTAAESVKFTLESEGEGVSVAPLQCLLKQHPEGGYVLITVNNDDAVMKASYDFSVELKFVQPLFEERPALDLKDGQRSFGDVHDPFEVHVYRIFL